MKRVLLIAYHFPPVKVSSGIQRTLRFAQYLPEFGWEPIVLVPHRRAYAETSDEDRATVAAMQVHDSFALDTARHLSIRGRYPGFAAVPDRWVPWWLGGVTTGLALIRKYRPQVIWSTYPIATAHLIGLSLARLTRIPWVADLRDPMAQNGYPPDPLTWKSFKWIEERVVARAAAVTFTTPGTEREYARRYPAGRARYHLIENGYDESAFSSAEARATARPAAEPHTLLHSGVIYPSERDPRQFLAALANLRAAGTISAQKLRVVLRATGHDDYLRGLIREAGVADLVQLAPPLPYAEALAEMLSSDALLILQAANCNDQIPAKLYEYLRARRPIVALTDPRGDTAQALQAAGIDSIVPLDSASDIAALLARLLPRIAVGSAPAASEAAIAQASRRGRTGQFADVLRRVTAG